MIINPTKPLRLFLVRHGETAANVELRYLGSRDDPLTGHGVWQADRLAQALGALPLAAVYTSPLRRAYDTAARIAGQRRLEIRVDQRLREESFGTWEGMSRGEVLDRSSNDALLLANWESDSGAAPPSGETLDHVQARVLELVVELAAIQPGAWIVVVSHVGPIKALLAAALGVPITAVRRLFLDPATISVVDWGTPPIVRLFNCHGHMGWQCARWMRTDNDFTPTDSMAR